MPRASAPEEAHRDEAVFAVGGVRASSAGWTTPSRAGDTARGPAVTGTALADSPRASGAHTAINPGVRAPSAQWQALPRPGVADPRASGAYTAAGRAQTPAQPLRAATGPTAAAPAGPLPAASSGAFSAVGGPGPKWRGSQGQQLDQALQALLPIDTPAAARLALHEALEPQQIAAGTTLVQAGSPATRALLVVSGELRVEVARGGAAMQLTTLRPGEVGGIDLILGLRNARATVVAQTPALLAVLDQRAYADLERTAPAASTRLLAGMLAAEARRVRVQDQSLRESLQALLPAPVAPPPPPDNRISQIGEGLAKLFRR